MDPASGLDAIRNVGLQNGRIAVVTTEAPLPLVTVGAAPTAAWLAAFVAGSRHSVRVAAGECGPDDVAWASQFLPRSIP